MHNRTLARAEPTFEPLGGRSGVLQYAVDLLQEIVKAGPGKVSARSCLDGDLELESIALVEFQIALEDAYDVQLDPITLVELNTLDRIVGYVIEEWRAAHEPTLIPD